MAIIDSNSWSSFWPNFAANFAATFIVGVVITALINWLWKKRTKIDARVLFQLRCLNDDPRVNYRFVLKNAGRQAFAANEIYWHIFIEEMS